MNKITQKFYSIEKIGFLKIIKENNSDLQMNSFYYENINSINKLDKIENNSYGVYVIEDLNSDLNNLYIGETKKGLGRFQEHSEIKKMIEEPNSRLRIHFFKFPKNSNVNKDILVWCENSLLQNAKIAGYNLFNKSLREKPDLNDRDSDYARNKFELIQEYLELTDIYFKETQNKEENIKKDIFSFSIKSSELNITKEENGFFLLKGSKYNLQILEESRNVEYLSVENVYKIIKENIDENGEIIRDILFKTPSGLADLAARHSTPAWRRFKNKEGKTLDEVYRKNK